MTIVKALEKMLAASYHNLQDKKISTIQIISNSIQRNKILYFTMFLMVKIILNISVLNIVLLFSFP